MTTPASTRTETGDTSIGGPRAENTQSMPTQLGRYRITGVLGRGGMGVVYTAHDPVLVRDVAVKLLSQDVGQSAQARLLREAQSMAKLADPHVVAVHDTGVHEGHVWVAMAKVEGETLRAWLRGDRALDARLDVLVQAARGLQAAHAAGITHRDFKPDNVIVGRDVEGRVRAQVLDFGIAAHADTEETAPNPISGAEDVADSRLTRPGAVLGTPAYMSPEQFRGDPVDPRSDQFSFAVTLYEAVWTTRPFAGDHARSIAMAVLHAPPVVPTTTTRIERALWRICQRALERDPDARYPSLAALIADLDRARARSTAPKWIAVGGAAVIASVAATVVATREEPCTSAPALGAEVWNPELATAMKDAFAATRKPWARDSATWVDGALVTWREGWVAAHDAACRATAVAHTQSDALLDRRMSCLERVRVEAQAIVGTLVEASGDVPRRATRLVGSLPDAEVCTPDAAGRILDGIDGTTDDAERADLRARLAAARARIEAGTYDGVTEQLEAIEAAAAARDDHELRARAMVERGRWLVEHGDPETSATYRAAMLLAIEHDAKPVAADAARWLAFVDGVKHGRLDSARDTAALSAALAGKTSADLLRVRAQIEFAAADYDRADALIDEAIAAVEATGAPALGEYLNTRGAIALRAGRYAEARADFERAIASVSNRLGAAHPDLGRFGVNLAIALERTGDLEGAIGALQRARGVLVADLGERDPTVATTDHNLAAFLELAGRAEEAIAPCERSIATMTATIGPDDPRLAGPWTILGRARLTIGQVDGASTAIERAIEIRTKALGPTHPDLALPLIARARLHLARGEAERALADTDLAISLVADATFDSSDRGELAMVHARALDRLDRRAEAAAWRSTARTWLEISGPAGRRLIAELEGEK